MISKRALSTLLAVALPVAISASSLAFLEKVRTIEDVREFRNAGHIVNGNVLDGGIVSYMESRLEKHEPEIVILGNSLSSSNINPALLAKRLGLPKHKVQLFGVPKSLGPHWFVIARNRIYANKHKPKIVLVLSDLQSLLAVTPRSEASYLNLSAQLGPKEALIDEKLGQRNYYVERIRQNRGSVRDLTLLKWRNASVNLFGRGLFSTQMAPVDEDALDRVFEGQNVDMALHNSVIPTFQDQAEMTPLFDPATLPMPRDSFIPDLTKIVARNGGVALYVRPPMSPSLPSHVGDIVLPGIDTRVHKLVTKHRGVYMDMRALPMNDSHFSNPDHMNSRGAKRFTEALAQLIRDEDLLQRRQKKSDDRNLEIEAFASVRLESGVLVNQQPAIQFATAPPPLAHPNRAITQGTGSRRAHMSFDVSRFSTITDSATTELTPFATRCSPLRVTEDGTTLPQSNVGCAQVFQLRDGRICHREDKIFLSASDQSNPIENGRTYAIRLDPERACEGAMWLYPGDEALIPIDLSDLSVFDKGARILRLNGHTMMGPEGDEGQLRLKLVVDGEERTQGNLTLDKLRGAPLRWLIKPILANDAQHAHVVLTNTSDSFLLMTSVALREYRPLNKRQGEKEPPKPKKDTDPATPVSDIP